MLNRGRVPCSRVTEDDSIWGTLIERRVVFANMSETRLTPDVELDGISTDEAFAVLGNEIRLDIIRVLWHADAAHRYDEVSDEAETLSFTDLRREVGLDDNGQFNYHLSKLAPHFVRQSDDGYRLSGAGKQIARTVIAISGTDDLDFSADIEQPCPLCDAPMTASYEDQWLRVSCTECDGQFGDETPHGSIFLFFLPLSVQPEPGAPSCTASSAFSPASSSLRSLAFLSSSAMAHSF